MRSSSLNHPVLSSLVRENCRSTAKEIEGIFNASGMGFAMTVLEPQSGEGSKDMIMAVISGGARVLITGTRGRYHLEVGYPDPGDTENYGLALIASAVLYRDACGQDYLWDTINLSRTWRKRILAIRR